MKICSEAANHKQNIYNTEPKSKKIARKCWLLPVDFEGDGIIRNVKQGGWELMTQNCQAHPHPEVSQSLNAVQ